MSERLMEAPGPAIYLETSAARAAGWPRVSASLERLAVLARGLRGEIFLPELVEIELEEGWPRGPTTRDAEPQKSRHSRCSDVWHGECHGSPHIHHRAV